MCLFIDKTIHPDNKPIITEKDIDCIKYLHKFSGGRYCTIIYDYPIKFKGGYCVETSAYLAVSYSRYYEHFKVEEGIHSCSIIFSGLMSGRPFYAMIPKGTEMFVGIDNDFTSTKLIIFKNSFYRFLYKLGLLNIS